MLKDWAENKVTNASEKIGSKIGSFERVRGFICITLSEWNLKTFGWTGLHEC